MATTGSRDPGRWPASVLIVDDHRVFAEVLTSQLRLDPRVTWVENAFSLGAGRAMLNKHRPDVVLLDLDIGGESGLDLVEAIDRMDPRPIVLMLSGSTDVGEMMVSLQAGADGWIAKDSRIETILTAVSDAFHGYLYLPTPALKPLFDRLMVEAKGPQHEPSFVDALSPRELEVLRCLVSGMTRAEIAGRLFVSTNTVRTHIQNVMREADVHSTLSLVAKAREVGVPGIDDPAGAHGPSPRHSSL